jgi:hypothetical protein
MGRLITIGGKLQKKMMSGLQKPKTEILFMPLSLQAKRGNTEQEKSLYLCR